MTTIRIDTEKQNKLDEIAKRNDRSRNYIINQAIDNYLELQEYHEKRIKLAIKQADAGKFASAEDVLRLTNKYKSQ
jgi:predicted transcriptional regulator